MRTDSLKKLHSDCFLYQKPSVIVPPYEEFIDVVDIALADASERAEAAEQEIEMLHGLTGELMEYVLLR